MDTQPAKAFFFDRDGIVNQRIMNGYVTGVEDFIMIPDFSPLFQFIKEQGFLAILVTNQQGVGKGLMSESDLQHIHDLMQAILLRQTGYQFDDLYAATELEVSRYSSCCGDQYHPPVIRRKPSPAMLLEARDRWNLDFSNSWMIGDSISDAEAGRAAGVRTILIGDFELIPTADYIYPTLTHALRYLPSMVTTAQ